MQRDTYYITVNTHAGQKDKWEAVTLEDATREDAQLRIVAMLAKYYAPAGAHVQEWFDAEITTNCDPDRFIFKDFDLTGQYILGRVESETQRQEWRVAAQEQAVRMKETVKRRDAAVSDMEATGPYTVGLKEGNDWQGWVDKNADGYGSACVYMARRVMELLDEVDEFDASDLITQADNSLEMGITGAQSGAIAHMVSTCHVRGDEFQKSWNKSWGQEDAPGAVNPAIWNISFDNPEEGPHVPVVNT